MFLLSERAKAIGALLIAQVVCLVSGLWLQDRFFASTVEHSDREQHWAELATATSEVIASLRQQPLADVVQQDSALSTTGFSTFGHHLEKLPAKQDVSVAVVDSQWRICTGSAEQRGKHLPWNSFDRPVGAGVNTADQGTARPLRGVLQTSTGPRAALAFPLHGRDGYIVVYGPDDSKHVAMSTVEKSLFQSTVVALIWTLGLLSVAAYLVVTPLFDKFAERRAKADAAALRQAESMARMRDAVIVGLVKLTESRDPETGFHLERIAFYSSRLAAALRRNPAFRRVVTPEFVKLIEISSILHDIGKVGVEDSILLKPGRLTDDERERMKLHAEIGGRCLQEIEERLGRSNFLQMAREIAFAHHERWDGGGYPYGLKGEQIPLAARLVAICDVYEALSSKRVYKEPLPHEECVERIRREAGKHFDPQIVECFLEIEGQFHEVARRYANPPTAKPATHVLHPEAAADVALPIFADAPLFDAPAASPGPACLSH